MTPEFKFPIACSIQTACIKGLTGEPLMVMIETKASIIANPDHEPASQKLMRLAYHRSAN